jgi:anti-sigma B factor antagonist
MDPLKIEHRGRRLYVEGEIDLTTADQFRAALEAAVAADPVVVIDMGGVTFIDASGLHALVDVADSLNGAAPLTLVNAKRAARLLDIVGLRGSRSLEIRDGDEGDGR